MSLKSNKYVKNGKKKVTGHVNCDLITSNHIYNSDQQTLQK